MPAPKRARRPLSLALGISLSAALIPHASGRQAQPPPQRKSAEQDEVIRVDTELVQAAVTVLDGKGQFVDGLRPEQFELRVDGRATPVSFFERVSAGTAKELALLAAAASRSPRGPSATENSESSAVGRTVYFFLDDLHLSAASVGRARRMVLNYVNGLMGEEDWAAVASTSGRIGFLQQLTDDKAVLRRAVGRVGYAQPIVTDRERPRIGVEEAFAVLEREDQNLLEHLVNETIKIVPGMTRTMAEAYVRSRVRDIMRATAGLNRNTLMTLHSLLRAAAARPGRKLVFFVSDGFMLQTQNADDRELLQRVTDAAARADAVVFSVDAKGLATDPDYQAARDDAFDSHGLVAAASPGALGLFLSQEPLMQLAAETGGRAVVNTNAPDAGIARALEETSRYYLLAWRPEGDGPRGGRFRRLEVRVAGRPDLSVRVHKGFLAPQASASAGTGKNITGSDLPAATGASPARAPQEELRAAVVAAYPPTRLPTTLSAVHTDAAGGGGATLAVSVGVGSESLTFKAVDGGRAAAAVDFACVVLDDEGKPTETLYRRLEAATRAAASEAGVPGRAVVQDFQFTLRPGLYQVRAAARDVVSGRTGGAVQWIEIPDLSKGGLALSGLALGEVVVAAPGAGAAGVLAAQAAARPTAGRPLARGSRLHFSAFVHNAARGANGALPPAVSVRAEVLAGGRVVADTGERDLSTDGLEDFARLPYAAEVGLEGLPAGRYLLRVTAVDRAAQAAVARQVKFEIR